MEVNVSLAKGYQLTPQQEAIIQSMFMAEKVIGVEELWFSPAYFRMSLGIRWNTYYRSLMDDLCELGSMERMFHKGSWWYQITPACRVNRDEFWRYGQRSIRKSLGDLGQQRLPNFGLE